MAAQIKNCFERYEKKYRLTAEQQRLILEGMRPYMKKDAYGAYTICNIYYDTDDWRLIRASLEKPVYKEKLRVRSYGVPEENGRVFVELKKKYDGVVYKRRITTEAREAAPFLAGAVPNGHGQIGQELLWFQQRYGAKPRVFIAYDRLAYHRPRHDIDGDQAAGGVSPVAQPTAVPRGGVPHLLLQIRLLLPTPHLTQGGTYLCLTRSLERN